MFYSTESTERSPQQRRDASRFGRFGLGAQKMRAKLRLFRLIWPFIAIIAAQVVLTGLSLELLSNVRAYAVGEGLWSKGQKEAIKSLQRYVDGGRAVDWNSYEAAIAIPLGDRRARLALEQNPPNLRDAEIGFVAGDNHPDDVPGLIRLFRYGSWLPYFADAVGKWQATDKPLSELGELAGIIRAKRRDESLSRSDMRALETNIAAIDLRLASRANAFSESLSSLSRLTRTILIAANALSGVVLLILLLWYGRNYIAETKANRQTKRLEQERVRTVLTSIGDAVVSFGPEGKILYLNLAAERLLQTDLAAEIDRHLTDVIRIVDSRTREINPRLIHEAVQAGAAHSLATRHVLMREDGSTVPVSLVGAPVKSADGITAAGSILFLRDITSEIEYVSRLAWQASHDELTGLINRSEFETRLGVALNSAEASNELHAMALLDLDQFKIVNDTCGHAAGDELLRQLARALEDKLGDRNCLARFGGDEFAVLLQRCSIDRAALICERLRSVVEEINFSWEGSQFSLSASIGLVQVSRGSVSAEDVIRSADVACYLAKDKGRNRIQLHDPNDAELRSRFGEMAWVQRIHEALEEDRLCLYAQPILGLKPGTASEAHAEILVRMRDREGKLIPPVEFIGSAERYGLMPLIDRWVVKNALRELADRGARFAICGINISGATFNDDDFVDFVREQFRVTGLDPASICFEITETAAITHLATADKFVRSLKALGCSFALDDFGAGMSSFAYLKNMPVDFIKIDGSFVRHMLDDPTDHAIVDLIARLGKVMGMRTIAEFVENDAMIDRLREIGVDYAQGYGISAPKPLEVLISGLPRHALAPHVLPHRAVA